MRTTPLQMALRSLGVHRMLDFPLKILYGVDVTHENVPHSEDLSSALILIGTTVRLQFEFYRFGVGFIENVQILFVPRPLHCA